MKPQAAAKNVIGSFEDVAETLNKQVAKPLVEDFANEFMGFFGDSAPKLGRGERTMAKDDLARARQEKALKEKEAMDNQESQQAATQVVESIYREHDVEIRKENGQMVQEVQELQAEIVQVAKAAGVESNIHIQNIPEGKVSKLLIKLLTSIVRTLRLKADESKSASELVSQRSNMRSTGMLAWVSGNQGKIHEQGTMQLQG